MSAAFANRASDFDRREEILPHFVNIYFFKACNLPFPSADSSWLVLLLSARSTNRAALPHVPALAYLCAYVCCQPTPSLLPLPADPYGSETSTIPPLAAYRALSLSLSLSLFPTPAPPLVSASSTSWQKTPTISFYTCTATTLHCQLGLNHLPLPCYLPLGST